MFLTAGRNGGVGQLPNKGGTVVGNFIVKLLKAKDLFVPHYRSRLNHKSDDGPENKGAYSNKLHSVQSLLSFTEEDARKLLVGLPARELESGQVLN